MIYLFLTAKNTAYLNDVFTTLHLQEGMLHRYKYNCRAGSSVVHKSIKLETNAERQRKTIENKNSVKEQNAEAVLISYIDRESTESKKYYIPLRRGELAGFEQIDGQLYFTVKLGSYCHANNEERFSEQLYNGLGSDIYQMIAKGKWDGYLAFRTEEPLTAVLDLGEAPDSWLLTAERLSRRIVFRQCYSVFTRLEMQDCEKKPVRITEQDGECGYKLKARKKYSLLLSYYIPAFNEDVRTSIPVAFREDCGMLKADHRMESRQNAITVPVHPADTDKTKRTVLSLVIETSDIHGKPVRYSPEAVNVWIESYIDDRIRKAMVGICMLVITLSAAVAAMPYESLLDELKASNSLFLVDKLMFGLCLLLKRYQKVYGVLCGALTSVSTFFMIRLTGKPKL